MNPSWTGDSEANDGETKCEARTECRTRDSLTGKSAMCRHWEDHSPIQDPPFVFTGFFLNLEKPYDCIQPEERPQVQEEGAQREAWVAPLPSACVRLKATLRTLVSTSGPSWPTRSTIGE